MVSISLQKTNIQNKVYPLVVEHSYGKWHIYFYLYIYIYLWLMIYPLKIGHFTEVQSPHRIHGAAIYGYIWCSMDPINVSPIKMFAYIPAPAGSVMGTLMHQIWWYHIFNGWNHQFLSHFSDEIEYSLFCKGGFTILKGPLRISCWVTTYLTHIYIYIQFILFMD